jgi:hypothetical protein
VQVSTLTLANPEQAPASPIRGISALMETMAFPSSDRDISQKTCRYGSAYPDLDYFLAQNITFTLPGRPFLDNFTLHRSAVCQIDPVYLVC